MCPDKNQQQKSRTEEVTILKPGRNCWALEPVERAELLIDGADYFAAFADACHAAKKQILILGWDFDRNEKLFREDGPHDQPHGDGPQKLGDFLVALTKCNEDLSVYLLSWDFNMIYAAEREFLPALKLRLQAPPRFHFRLDGVHPKGASHHQKLVVIDDRIAFVGGIDLSRWRWDTCEHLPNDCRRRDPNGKDYPPFHDMMLLVQGKAAVRLGELARERWKRACGWNIRAPRYNADSTPWPEWLNSGVTNAQVGIARTEPKFKKNLQVDEVLQLYLDAIASATHSIYIENQYFTSERLTQALRDSLQQKHGPEVVLVLPQKTGGWLEQATMDVLRSRAIQVLRNEDTHNRLRIYYPHQLNLGEECISVHAKLMIVDDRLLRVGSANASNRSMGLDTECDLALESKTAGDHIADFIRGSRSRLLAEHLDCNSEQIDHALSQQKGLISAIESLRKEGRSLYELDCAVPQEVDDIVPDAGLIDPPEPFSSDYFVAQYIPDSGRDKGQLRLVLFLAVIAGLLALAAVWRWTPLYDLITPGQIGHYLAGFQSEGEKIVVAIGGFVIASLLMVPVTLLAVIAGIVLKGWLAFASVMTGAMIAALIGFLSGRVLGRRTIDRLGGARLGQVGKRIAKRGAVAIAILRLVPIAPFAVFNLLAGSSKVGVRQFLLGSLIGLAPGMGAITLFSSSLWQAITAPTLTNIIIALSIGGVMILLAMVIKHWLRTS